MRGEGIPVPGALIGTQIGTYSRGYLAQLRTRVRESGHLPVLKCPVHSGTD
jgi:hypothetical protein